LFYIQQLNDANRRFYRSLIAQSSHGGILKALFGSLNTGLANCLTYVPFV
jgi:hypothetical protein